MKKLIFIFIGISILLVGCNGSEPKFTIETVISDVSDEEYEYFGKSNTYEGTSKEDFRKLTFKFSMEHEGDIKRSIEMYEGWRDALNNYDEYDRYWFGSSSSQDNLTENFAEYHYELFFYSKGLSEENIKNIFANAHIRVEWVTDKNTHSKDYLIKDTIKFQK